MEEYCGRTIRDTANILNMSPGAIPERIRQRRASMAAKQRKHHTCGAVLYACSVLSLTAAMWFCAAVSGYQAGLALRPAAAIMSAPE